MEKYTRALYSSLFFVVAGIMAFVPIRALALELVTDTAANLGITTSAGDTTTTTGAATTTTTSVTVGSSSLLRAAVDSLLSADTSSCKMIDDAVQSLSTEERASLAWQSDSYSKNIDLHIAGGATAEDATTYGSLQDNYDDINSSLSGASSSRVRAALRSTYLELLAEYRSGKPDAARVTKLKNFLSGAEKCAAAEGSDNAFTKAIGNIGVTGSTTTTVEQDLVVRGDDVKSDEEIKAPKNAKSVVTKVDLENYIKAKIQDDDRISSVTTGKTQTETVYKQRGKLFGFIPLWMKVKVHVTADKSTEVRYPWYKFMTKAVGTKVTSEMIAEETMNIGKGETLSASDQALSVDAAVKAFGSVEAK